MKNEYKARILGRIKSFIIQFFKVFVILKKDKSRLPLLKRVHIILWYLKFTFKDLFLERFLKKKIKSEKFLSYSVCFFSYSSFRNLFVEIFVLQQYYFKTVKQNPYIIDCGANIGMSVLFFKFLYPGSNIIAFEPDENSFALLKENIKNNKLSGVKIYNLALLNKKGEVTLYVNKLNNSVNTVIKGIFKKEELIIKKVRSEILSSFISCQVDLLKIDVEGSEDMIMLELAKKNALKFVKDMVVEYHPYLCQKIKTVAEFLHFLKF